MSGPFITSAGTEDVEVPCVCGNHEKDTITVIARFSGAVVSEIDSAMFEVHGDGNPRANMGAANRKMMELCVVGWSFTGSDGAPIPFDPELINEIDARAWSPVVEYLNDRLTEVKNPTKASEDADEKPRKRRSERS